MFLMEPMLTTEAVGYSLANGFYTLFEICWPTIAPMVGAAVMWNVIKLVSRRIFMINHGLDGYSSRQIKRKLAKVDAGIDMISNGLDIYNGVYRK